MKHSYGDIHLHNIQHKKNIANNSGRDSYHNSQQSAIIVEGGAMRCIYSAGILDSFIQHDYYTFEHYVGISAGASNLASYLGKKHGRIYKIYTEYCQRTEFKNVWRFLKGGHLIDIDWLWNITEKDLPIGKSEIIKYGERFKLVATCAETAEAHYITPDIDELFTALKCSANMPVAFKGNIQFRGKVWFDGGVADSLAIHKLYEMGARRILVLRSNNFDYVKKPYKFPKAFRFFLKEYPAILKKLATRHDDYNKAVAFIRNPPADCEVIEVCPPADLNIGQFTTNPNRLNDAYAKGVAMGITVMQTLEGLR